ncbi:MAG: hypothetical protein AMK69_16165 [Nitrospira bacterium SG8_3]|nr:MAG: hypothetical protein AMK69_16165 [Nitrospira bacterium SG8_3]
MDFKKHIVRAWELTLQFIVSLVLMTLVMSAVAVVTLGILAPVMMAGYMQSILLMVREGREPRIQDLFSEMRLFFPLLGFGLVTFIAVVIGFMLLVIPGFLLIMAISFSCLYVLPLMTDKKLGLVEAIKESYSMAVRDNIPEHIVVAILFLAISGIGSSFLIGFLFTQPLATVFLLSVYDERTSSPGLTVG